MTQIVPNASNSFSQDNQVKMANMVAHGPVQPQSGQEEEDGTKKDDRGAEADRQTDRTWKSYGGEFHGQADNVKKQYQ
jgi:hypothetical protein